MHYVSAGVTSGTRTRVIRLEGGGVTDYTMMTYWPGWEDTRSHGKRLRCEVYRWGQMWESNPRLKAYETCDLTVCPIYHVGGPSKIRTYREAAFEAAASTDFAIGPDCDGKPEGT